MKSIINHHYRANATCTFALVFMCLSKWTDKIAIIVYNSELMTVLSVVIIVVANIMIVMQYDAICILC